MLILMPTCNRAEMALENTQKLKDAERVILCVNNCDIKQYRMFRWPKNVFIQDMTFIKGDPKECHNKTFRMMIQIKANLNILVLEDDCTPCDNFVNDFYSKIRLIPDKDFTLSPIYIPEKKCHYTDAEENEYEYGDHKFITQKYVDGNFYFTKGIHEDMKTWLLGAIPVKTSTSGIGPFLSRKIHAEGIKMYRTEQTMVEHGDHESLQFGDRRKKVPLIAKFQQNV